MGRKQFTVRTGLLALVGGETHSLMVFQPTSASLFTIIEIGFSIDSATAAAGVGLELYAVTTVGTISGGSFTPVIVKRGSGIAAQTLVKVPPFTNEPTAVEVIKDWSVPPTGLFVIQFPLGREPESFIGTALPMGLRYVNPAGGSTAKYRAYMEFEE